MHTATRAVSGDGLRQHVSNFVTDVQLLPLRQETDYFFEVGLASVIDFSTAQKDSPDVRRGRLDADSPKQLRRDSTANNVLGSLTPPMVGQTLSTSHLSFP